MDSSERRRRIEMLAHQIWEAEARPDGQGHRHWHTAERLVEAELEALHAGRGEGGGEP